MGMNSSLHYVTIIRNDYYQATSTKWQVFIQMLLVWNPIWYHCSDDWIAIVTIQQRPLFKYTDFCFVWQIRDQSHRMMKGENRHLREYTYMKQSFPYPFSISTPLDDKLGITRWPSCQISTLKKNRTICLKLSPLPVKRIRKRRSWRSISVQPPFSWSVCSCSSRVLDQRSAVHTDHPLQIQSSQGEWTADLVSLGCKAVPSVTLKDNRMTDEECNLANIYRLESREIWKLIESNKPS